MELLLTDTYANIFVKIVVKIFSEMQKSNSLPLLERY